MNIEHLVENYDDRNKQNNGDIIIAHRLLVTMEANKKKKRHSIEGALLIKSLN
jgi:hypothetical protein